MHLCAGAHMQCPCTVGTGLATILPCAGTMTDISSHNVDELADFLTDNEIPSDVVLLLCGKERILLVA